MSRILPGRIKRTSAHALDRQGWIVAVVIGCLLAASVRFFPGGFQGGDDLHYLQAAQRWIEQGAHVPEDHWGARLPFVLSIAAGLALFGTATLALALPNLVGFVVTLVAIWDITRTVAGEKAGPWSVLAAGLTPLVFSLPTIYYPESLEVAFVAVSIALTLRASLRSVAERERAAHLFCAGLAGALALLTRETAVAWPVAASLFLLTDHGRPLARRLGDVLVLGAAYVPIVGAEMLFYTIVSGHPLDRYRIDLRHTQIPSFHLDGSASQEIPLFNWSLAKRWAVYRPVQLHWSVDMIFTLLLSPWVAPIFWMSVPAVLYALRSGGVLGRFAILAVSFFLVQYSINMFVLVVSPVVRYYILSCIMASVLVGVYLASLARHMQALLVGGILILPVALVTATRAPLGPEVAHALAGAVTRLGSLHVTEGLFDVSYLEIMSNPGLASALVVGPPPIGGLSAFGMFSFRRSMLDDRCEDGALRWERIDEIAPRALMWDILEMLKISPFVPDSIASSLRREPLRLTIARRLC